MLQCHSISKSVVVGNIRPVGIVTVVVLVFGKHNTMPPLTVDNIKECNTLLGQFNAYPLTVGLPNTFSGKKGIFLLFIKNLGNIFRNSNFHDVSV